MLSRCCQPAKQLFKLRVRYLFSGNKVIVSDEVQQALAAGRPVVALESTIISHGGMPFPKNLQVGRALEKVVRDGGAVPATCAVVDGIPRVGLSDLQMQSIANAPAEKPVLKASRRDMGYAVASGMTASTTVSGTMVLAAHAGVRVFATGGIGGVHRSADGSPSIDVSADLTELARTPITVVCAGVKSILHIPATLEVLETYGVPVLAYQTTAFPAFFTADSGIPAPLVAQSASHVAAVMHANDALNMRQGLVLAVPTPEPFADAAQLKACVDEALVNAAKEGITGARITPYLLAAITRLTGGASLEANVKLVLNNARVATEVAVCFAAGHTSEASLTPNHTSPSATAPGGVVVFGGAALDSISTVMSHPLKMNASNPGATYMGLGGVGRNVAEKLIAQGIQVSLISIVADDEAGKQLLAGLQKIGVNTSGIRVVNAAEERSARYTAIHASNGELIVSVADMEIFAKFVPADVRALTSTIKTANVVVSDANFGIDTLLEVANICRQLKKPMFFEPTSDHKARLAAPCVELIDVIKPNVTELLSILGGLLELSEGKLSLPASYEQTRKALHGNIYDAAREIPVSDIETLSLELWKLMLPGHASTPVGKHVVTSLGERGIVWVSSAGVAHVPSPKLGLPSLNSNGAGDVVMSGLAAHVSSGGTLNLSAIKASIQLATQHIILQSQKLD